MRLHAYRVDGAQWDRIVGAFDQLCQEQLFTYAAGRWPQMALEPTVFERDGLVVGGALVMLQPLPLGVGTIALVKWGPMLAASDTSDGDVLMREMIGHLQQEYAHRRGMMLSIMEQAAPGSHNPGYERLIAMGFKPGTGLRAPDRYVVDVTLDDEARMAGFAQKWRYHLRKAIKGNLTFQHGNADDLERFMVLYRAMSARKKFADHSAIDTVADLLGLPEGGGRPELFFVTHHGETVAGAIIFSSGKMATYLYGATNDDALALRAGFFLHWHIIRWLRENTAAVLYDLGGTDGSDGLHQFKSGMVGSAGYIAPLPPTANYARGVRSWLAGTLAYGARAGVNTVRDAINMVRLELARRVNRR